jgi:hypothetical protein
VPGGVLNSTDVRSLARSPKAQTQRSLTHSRSALARSFARADDPLVAKLYPNGPDAYPGDVGFDPWNFSKDAAALVGS